MLEASLLDAHFAHCDAADRAQLVNRDMLVAAVGAVCADWGAHEVKFKSLEPDSVSFHPIENEEAPAAASQVDWGP